MACIYFLTAITPVISVTWSYADWIGAKETVENSCVETRKHFFSGFFFMDE